MPDDDALPPVTEPAVAPASSDASADTAPETITTETTSGTEPADMLSAVRAVLPPPADPPPAVGSSEGSPESPPGTDPAITQTGAEPPKELTPADFADVEKPSVHKRVERLFADRAAARAEVQTLRQPADHWNRHVEYLQQNNITPDDAQALYGVGALIGRGDWKNAADAIRPYYELCLKQIGEVLPEDLQRRVDEGALAADDAHEIARAQAAANQARHQASLTEARHTQDATQQRVTSVRTALSDWETGLAQRDPDFALIRNAVNAHAKALVAERGLPPDAGTAIAWANEAYGSVRSLLQAARPAARATAPRPSSVAPAARAAPEPRSLREAVELALHR